MKLLYGLKTVPVFEAGTVATIGNFDGVHLGHQALLAQLKAKALELRLPLVVLLFEPQPSEFFCHHSIPARLSSLREKLELLANSGVDYVYCLSFNKTLAAMSASAFIDHYLVSLLRVNYLLLGADFRFGRQRQGDIALLKRKLTVEIFPDFMLNNHRISSTSIRDFLSKGELKQASLLLGRPYSLHGRVIHGDGRGKQWGFPTANLAIRRLILPLAGVFCVKVKRANGTILEGVANIGCRPTVDGKKNILEVHLFEMSDSLYGEKLQVNFLHKLREEIKFSSVDALIAQIHNDISAASAYFLACRSNLNTIPGKICIA